MDIKVLFNVLKIVKMTKPDRMKLFDLPDNCKGRYIGHDKARSSVRNLR